MNRSPAVEAFLAELREGLRMDAARRTRVLAETEDHIAEATRRLRVKGLSPDEAANQAIAEFGPAKEIAQRFAEQSQPRKEERMRFAFNRRSQAMAVLGMIAMSPALFFVSVSILKYNLGVPLPFEPLDLLRWTGFESLERLAPAVFVGGVGCAFVLNLLAMTDLDVRWAEGRLSSEMSVAPKRLNIVTAVAGGLILATMVGYVLVENLAERRVGEAAGERVQQAFVVRSLVKHYDANGVERSSSDTLEAFRGDGSKAVWSRASIAALDREPVRVERKTVDDRGLDRFAIVALGERLISSHPIPKGPDGYRWPWATTAPQRCSWLLAALELDADVERNNILGYDVIKHDYGNELDGRFVEVLGCAGARLL